MSVLRTHCSVSMKSELQVLQPVPLAPHRYKYSQPEKKRILYECSCFIEFIKQVEEKRKIARLAE